MIFDFEIQTGPKKQRTAVNIKREANPRWRLASPNKRFSYEKCFVIPEVDLKVNPKFIVLNVFS